MSEPDITALLARVAAHSPTLDVSVPQVVQRGRRRVRVRRAAVTGGAGIAALALTGSIWAGLAGFSGPEDPGRDRAPAATGPVSFDQSLTSSDGTVFRLTVEGSTVQASHDSGSYPTTLRPDEGPLVTLLGQGRPVMFVPGWELVGPEVARIGSPGVDGTTTWVAPVDAEEVRLEDGTRVAVLALPTSGLGAPPHVLGQVQPDGTVQPVDLPGQGGTT